MSPTAMTGMNSMGQVDDGSFTKQASAAMAAIAEMYKQAHVADPGGPLASQLQMLMDAVADAEGEYMGAGAAAGEAAAAAPDSAVPMEGDEMIAEQDPGMEAMPPGPEEMGPEMEMDPSMLSDVAGPPPTSWDDATSQADMMLDMSNARKRR